MHGRVWKNVRTNICMHTYVCPPPHTYKHTFYNSIYDATGSCLRDMQNKRRSSRRTAIIFVVTDNTPEVTCYTRKWRHTMHLMRRLRQYHNNGRNVAIAATLATKMYIIHHILRRVQIIPVEFRLNQHSLDGATLTPGMCVFPSFPLWPREFHRYFTKSPPLSCSHVEGQRHVILGIDSVSRLTWMRSLPKTYDHLENACAHA